MKNFLLGTCIAICSVVSLSAQDSFSEKSKKFQPYEGYFRFLYDDDSDKVYLQVDDLETEFLYVYSLSAGVGSNDIGLVLASNRDVHPQVNAIVNTALAGLKKDLLREGDSEIAREMVRRITRFETHPEEFRAVAAPKIPDGSPIGMACTQE